MPGGPIGGGPMPGTGDIGGGIIPGGGIGSATFVKRLRTTGCGGFW